MLILLFLVTLSVAKNCEYYHYGGLISDIKNNYQIADCYNASLKCFDSGVQFYCIAENIILHNDDLYLNCTNSINWKNTYKNFNLHAYGAQKWLHDKLQLKSIDISPRYIDHDVYFVNNIYHTPNPWHAFEDITHLFEMIESYNIGSNLEIVFTKYQHDRSNKMYSAHYDFKTNPLELYLKPYSSIWKTFAPVHRIKKIDDFLSKDEYIQIKRAIFNVHGSSSMFDDNFFKVSSCKNSTFINRLINNLNLTYNENRTIYVTRGSLSMNRRSGILNEDEILSKLIDLNIQIVDMALLSDDDQMKLASETTTIIGIHGAALAWSFFMREGSKIIEIRPKSTLNNCKCFENIAIWRNHQYIKIYNESDYIDIDNLLKFI